MSKQDKLNQQKRNAIADIIATQPLQDSNGKTVTPSAAVIAQFSRQNIWTRVKYTLTGMAATAFPAALCFNNDSASDLIDVDMLTRTIIGAAAAFGAAGGYHIAEHRNNQRMWAATAQNRATQILPRLEILKSRPWTRAEELNIEKLVRLTDRKLSPEIMHTIVSEMSRMDPGYERSLDTGRLAAAPKWVKVMIRTGALSRTY